jgi:hypothetical protein
VATPISNTATAKVPTGYVDRDANNDTKKKEDILLPKPAGGSADDAG